jgi:hypothetical protein
MTIESFNHKGFTVEIEADECPESPREWDNLSEMVCFHTRYNLGDKNHGYNSKDFSGWEELQNMIEKDHRPVVILPLYMMDHSGLTISTNPERFRAFDQQGWDWGQIGFVFVSREKALEECGGKIITPKICELAEKVLLGEVETYAQYLRGDVYSYSIKDADGEVVDSCSGFYGLEYVKEEAKNAVTYAVMKTDKDATEEDSLFIFAVEHTIVAKNEQEAREKLQKHLNENHSSNGIYKNRFDNEENWVINR